MWSYFKKVDIEKVMLDLIKDLKVKYNTSMKYARCDNAGENEKFKRACIQEGMGLQFSYTAPGTLQQNDHVEWKFTILFNRIHAMLNQHGHEHHHISHPTSNGHPLHILG